MNVKTSIEGANSLTKNALDHCIFPITHRDDIQKYGPMIMASGSGVKVVDIHGKTYLDMMSSMSRATRLATATKRSPAPCMSRPRSCTTSERART